MKKQRQCKRFSKLVKGLKTKPEKKLEEEKDKESPANQIFNRTV